MVISYQEEIKRKQVHLSSLWMTAAALLIFAVLPVIARLAEPDSASCGRYFGRLFDKHKIANGKSVECTASFAVFDFAALSAVFFVAGMPECFYIYGAIAVILAAVGFFQKQLKVDDNFTVPLTT